MKLIRHLFSLWRYYRGQRSTLIHGLFWIHVYALALVPVPLLMKHLVDVAIPEKHMSLLFGLCLGMFLLYGLASASYLKAHQLIANATSDMIESLQQRLSQNESLMIDGDKTKARTLFLRNMQRIHRMGIRIFEQSLPSLSGMLAFFGILAWLDPMLTTLIVVCLVLTQIPGRSLSAKLKKAVRITRKSQERLDERIEDAVASSREAPARSRLLVGFKRFARLQKTLMQTRASYTQGQSLAIAAAAALILFSSAYLVIRGNIELGTFVAFLWGFQHLRGQMVRWIGGMGEILSGADSLSEVSTYLQNPAQT